MTGTREVAGAPLDLRRRAAYACGMGTRIAEIVALARALMALGAPLAVAAALLDCKRTAQAQESGGKRRQTVADGGAVEPDCAPYPFDIMAIHALRQSVG